MDNAQMFMSAEINEIAGALAKAQAVMGGAKKGATNPHLKNKYADLASVMDTVKEPLTSNGLAITQLLETVEGQPAVRTLLVHTSGQWFMSLITLSAIENKGVNAAQAMGVAISYMRRYAASAITGLHQEDDDAASAKSTKIDQPKPKPDPEPTEEEQLELVRLKTEAENNCNHIKNLKAWYAKHTPEIDKLPAKLRQELKGHVKVLGDQFEKDTARGEG